MVTMPSTRLLAALPLAAVLGACATRSNDVQPLATDPSSFASWRCDALYDEADRVRQRAAHVAYAVDERAGNNIIACIFYGNTAYIIISVELES